MINRISAIGLVALVCGTYSQAQTKTLASKANTTKGEIQPTMYGVFFEDINFGADGGIYAELVKNRSFEFFRPMMGWTVQPGPAPEGTLQVFNRQEDNVANPRYLRVKPNKAVKGSLGLTNEGFRGMGIKKDVEYTFSVMYRQAAPGVKLHVELINTRGTPIGGTVLEPNQTGAGWHKQSVKFKATDTALKGKMNLWFEGTGT